MSFRDLTLKALTDVNISIVIPHTLNTPKNPSSMVELLAWLTFAPSRGTDRFANGKC